jgi:acyl-CoA synthetase (AMP-forming)/AMP-acid ligase II
VIITGGENVFPVEVEDVVAGYPGVLQSAVFGRLDTLWGERVEAAIVCGRPVDVEELRSYCRTRLAGYKVPRRFHVVAEMPLTAAAKVDKRRLSEVLSDD